MLSFLNFKEFDLAKDIFKAIPLSFTINLLLLLLVAALEVTTVFSLAPVVDIVKDPTLKDGSEITLKFLNVLKFFHINVSLLNFATLFLLLNVIKNLVFTLSRYYSIKIRYIYLEHLLLNLTEKIFSTRWSFFTNSSQGVLLNTLNREFGIIGESASKIFLALTGAVKLIFILGAIAFISWKVGALCIVASILLMLPSVIVGRLSYRYGTLNTSTANDLQVCIQEALDAAKLVMGFGNQKGFLTKLREKFVAHVKVTIPAQMITNYIQLFYEPLLLIILFALMYASVKIFGNTISETLIILYSIKLAVPLVITQMTNRQMLQNSHASFEQFQKIFDNATEHNHLDGTEKFEGLHDSILLENVAFSYGSGKEVINNVSLTIKKGEMVAFSGKSGAGKTTLFDLLMGFYVPTKGKILIDGKDLRTMTISSFRERIGYVPQDSFLFNQTLRENLLWSQPSATEDDIWEALKLANAADFVSKLPDGVDTIVGDKGVRLSGGQRQRISLCRAILRKPDILMLDEATSSLDSESEREIQKALENIAGKMTVIIIAHRLSTIVKADKIFYLSDGNLLSSGKFLELIENNQGFRSLAAAQGMIP